jgi:signal transduction histidine kinase
LLPFGDANLVGSFQFFSLMFISHLRKLDLLLHCFVACLLFVGYALPAHSQDFKKVDSLKKELLLSKQQAKFEILNQLFKQYYQTDYKVALDYAIEFNDLAKQVGDSVKIIDGGRMMAHALMYLERNGEAIEILIKIYAIADRNKAAHPELKKQIKFILNNAGITYTYLGNYDKALEYHFKSLVIREEEGDKKSIGTTLNNLGFVFYYLKDYQLAIEYYQKALLTKREIGDMVDLDRILINLGLCHNQVGDHKNAISYFNQGFAICGESCSDDIRREGLLGLGAAYYGNKVLDKAEDCFLKSLEISRAQKNSLYQVSNLLQLSLVETSKGDKEKGLHYLEEALTIAEASDFVDPLIQIYDQFSKLYSEKSDYKKTAYYLGKYKQLKDSIYNNELIKNLAKVQTSHAERENLKTIKEQEEIMQLRQTQYFFVLAIIFLMLGLAVILLAANKRQQRASATLALANERIEEQNRLLEERNKELDSRVKQRTIELSKSNLLLTEANSELDNFLYKTSHDIRGPLVTLQGLCNLGLIEAKEPAVTEILGKLSAQSDKMTSILSRLTAVGEVNQTTPQPVKINFKKILDDILKGEEKNFQSKNIKVTYTIDDPVTLISDVGLLKSILENLIDNGIKFYNSSSRVDPFVHVSIFQKGQQVVVRVEDNGIGILNAPPDQIFHMFMRASERSETGGVGLYLSKACTYKLGGEIMLERSDKDGTVFILQLPVDLSPILELRAEQGKELEKLQRQEMEKNLKMTASA